MQSPVRLRLLALAALAALCALALPAAAQIPAVIVGRVEDAATRAPLADVRIDVEAEAALTQVFTQLENRRNAYPYSVATYDRDVLEGSFAYGSAWEFLKSRLPDMYECAISLSGLCVGDPVLAFDARSLTDRAPPRDHDPLQVCIDGIESTAAIQELRTIGIHRLALVEVYRGGRGGVRVYSTGYLMASARAGGVYIAPTHTWGRPGSAFSGRC